MNLKETAIRRPAREQPDGKEAMSSEVFPNITWEAEAHKVMAGSEWQRSDASSIRCFHAAIQLAEQDIKEGADPLKRLAVIRHWLTLCLYSCNMENFKP